MEARVEVEYVGTLQLVAPLIRYTPKERERIADALSSIAADILKGSAGLQSDRYQVLIPVAFHPSTG